MKGMGKYGGMWRVKGSVERCVGGGVGKCVWVCGEVWEVCWGMEESGKAWGGVENVGEVCGSVFGVWGGAGKCVWKLGEV